MHPDVNRDHRALFDSVAVATRPVPGQPVRRVLTYAPTSSTEWTPAPPNWFVPNWFVDVSATLERKLEAFACFETEQRPYPHPRSERASAPPRSSSARAPAASTPSRSCSSAMSSDQPRRSAAHVLVALVVVGLLGGTAAAFALTEQLKLERSPVYRTRVGKLLGPNCRCGLARIPVRFLLRKRETLTVVIVDSHERVVRNLLTRTPRPRGVQAFTLGRAGRLGTRRPGRGLQAAASTWRGTAGRS